jgi:hypothetical protein
MGISNELVEQYQKWFEIVMFEHHTIKERNWSQLDTYSARKQEIVDTIISVEAKDPHWKNSQPDSLRILIHQLADLEQLNHTLLSERISEMKVQISDMTQRKQRLKKIRTRYKEAPVHGLSISRHA